MGLKDITFSLSGPTQIIDGLTFFFTGRYFDDGGHTYGRRIYNISVLNHLHPLEMVNGSAMDPWEKISAKCKINL